MALAPPRERRQASAIFYGKNMEVYDEAIELLHA
jgi:hypothetical protein